MAKLAYNIAARNSNTPVIGDDIDRAIAPLEIDESGQELIGNYAGAASPYLLFTGAGAAKNAARPALNQGLVELRS